jgi:hypothetical protein
MHGIIFVELKKYVKSKVGPGTWETLLAKSGLTRTSYLITSVYPDEEMVALVHDGVLADGYGDPGHAGGLRGVPRSRTDQDVQIFPSARLANSRHDPTHRGQHPQGGGKGDRQRNRADYDERIMLSESTCMLHGDRACTISVRLVGSSSWSITEAAGSTES